jgi:CheY-like chemotaxis protein
MSVFNFLKRWTERDAEPAVQAPTTVTGERRRKQRRKPGIGATILIVDDSKTIVASLRKVLRQNGFITIEALDAETALTMLQAKVPDLVFLDIVLPGINGFDALRRIRKSPGIAHVPVIMMSGNENATEQFYVQRIGANDFMKKPFSRAEVFSRVERLLGLEPISIEPPGPVPTVERETS